VFFLETRTKPNPIQQKQTMMDDSTPDGDENSVVGAENLQNGNQKLKRKRNGVETKRLMANQDSVCFFWKQEQNKKKEKYNIPMQQK
jgi:hypothetical protein